MNLRLLTTPLLATGLLLSTLGCSKKDDPAPDATSTAGYTIDGRDVKCNAIGVHTTSYGFDVLTVTLTTTPQPSTGPEVLTLTLTKTPSEPIDRYTEKVTSLAVTTTSGATTTIYGGSTTMLRTETNGKIAGDFITHLNPSASAPIIVITKGYFTGIQP